MNKNITMNKDIISKILGVKGEQEFEKKLKMFSVSDSDYQMRRKAFSRTIENTLEINNSFRGNRKSFSFGNASVSAGNLAGTAIYSGVMRSFVNSIAPIFAVQRNIDAPSQKVMFVDFYDILSQDYNAIVPNIGADRNWVERKDTVNEEEFTGADAKRSVTYTVPIMPGSFKAKLYVEDSGEYKPVGDIFDNGDTTVVATPGIIDATKKSFINYNDNKVASFELNLKLDNSKKYKLKYTLIPDPTAQKEVNKAFGVTKYYDIDTHPLLVPVERNIISDHAMTKQGIINPDELYSNFIDNEYTKAINNMVVSTMVNNFTGPTYNLDLSSFTISSGYYDTIVRSFRAMLTQGENKLAEQTYKGASCTGYLASPEACNIFDLMTPGDGWVRNVNSTYFKDIHGWYNEVPVVRTNKLGEGELMLTLRTSDGYVGPVYHGIFLAPTELPIIANYANMTNVSSGLYSMEGARFSESALCVKLKVVAPADLTLKLK